MRRTRSWELRKWRRRWGEWRNSTLLLSSRRLKRQGHQRYVTEVKGQLFFSSIVASVFHLVYYSRFLERSLIAYLQMSFICLVMFICLGKNFGQFEKVSWEVFALQNWSRLWHRLKCLLILGKGGQVYLSLALLRKVKNSQKTVNFNRMPLLFIYIWKPHNLIRLNLFDSKWTSRGTACS